MRKRLNRSNNKDTIGIVDVARAAGVSTASVSRVLNSPNLVKTKTREPVQAAIKKLGYIPNGAARALSSQRSNVIAAIIPTIDHSIFAHGTQALQSYLQFRGFNLLLASSNYEPQQEYLLCQKFLVQKVDGILMVGESHLPECVQLLDKENTPYINVSAFSPEKSAYCVGFDNAAAIAKGVEHLLELGHRKFSMIAGISANNDRVINRINGVRQQLKKHNIIISRNHLIESRYELQDARAAFRQLMHSDDPPTCVICGNDVLAFGAIFEAQRINLRIPQQVSVIGFDDLDMARHIKPSLTTIRVPTQLMWTQSADVLLDKLKGVEVPRATQVDTCLIVRESTAPPPDAAL